MSTVYVIGAGASHGEFLQRLQASPSDSDPYAGFPPCPPPMTRGFFNNELLDKLINPQTKCEFELEFKEVIAHIRRARLIDDAFGEKAWQALDLEEIFTSIEIEREFQNPESDRGAELLLIRNGLIRYIRSVMGLCTKYSSGKYYGVLREGLKGNDSVITFNWDLLLDQEFIQPRTDRVMGQYSKFFATVKPTDTPLHE